MKKNIYLFCCLILLAFNMQFSLAVKPDLTNPKYIQIKTKLINKVEKNKIEDVKLTLARFYKFLANQPGANILEEDYEKDVSEQYEKDLLQTPKGNSAIDIALRNKNFELLDILLDKLNINYIDFVRNSGILNPNTDTEYKKIKTELIQASNDNDVKQVQTALYNFSIYIRNPVRHINQFQNEKANLYYIETLSNYLADLLPEPLQIATKIKSYPIIYLLLAELKFYNFFEKNLKIVRPFTNLDNQPIKALLDSCIIKQIGKYIKFPEYRINDKLLEFLKKLKDIGFTQERIQNILARAGSTHRPRFYETFNDFKEHFIEELKTNNLVNDNFENEFKREIISDELFYYIDRASLSDAEVLINRPEINVNAIDINGNTPLILAIDKSSAEKFQDLADLLIKKADLNQPGEKGMTPLMHAIEKNNLGTILLLLDKGANPNLKDIFGNNALDYARETKNAKIIKYIQEYMAQTKIPLNEQLCALNILNSTLVTLANRN